MPTPNNIQLRSEEIQELLTRIPSAIIRWGITALFVCVILIFAMAYMIKVPEKIEGTFLLKESETGQIIVPVKNTGLIQKGQKVNIELDNFPSAQFGAITSVVDSLTYEPLQKKYIIFTGNREQLVTNFDIPLRDLPYVEGRASIIIDEKRLLFKFLPFLSS